MVSLNLGETLVTRDGNKVYFIAEIGQNHQGCLELAKKMILKAKKIGCDCVKFQKSCLEAKFTESALSRPYDSIHSWGKTYGEHKEYLEFDIKQYHELQCFCKEIGIDFTASAMDEVSLEQLDMLNVPFIKIGSGDANNFPLLEKAAKLERPLVISTGMQTMETIERIVEIMKNAKKTNYALMHCVSSYPTEAKDCQIKMITNLKNKFPHCVIGYSGHELGVDISKAAVLLGARIIERHFTLDKKQKGSDHKCSLEPSEMAKLIEDVSELMLNFKSNQQDLLDEEIIALLPKTSSIKEALDSFDPNDGEERCILSCEMNCREKLGKLIVASQDLKAGHIINIEDLSIKVSEPNGISAEFIDNVVGSELSDDIERDNPITWDIIIKMESTQF
ncbi:sialic acid synthase [Lucilia cuprina]|uniref:sialic acid synthase n=1 Tax=Lucilia cuprina TaxID=7375 RepID=UPI001F0607DA|nr:sialic acid synthase [Lucilia cuprina]XP_046805645.1 sialic acid synthase [Lucilia cuprina]XP_046805646.1 sialic acid synthase [Lucilia cuprina]